MLSGGFRGSKGRPPYRQAGQAILEAYRSLQGRKSYWAIPARHMAQAFFGPKFRGKSHVQSNLFQDLALSKMKNFAEIRFRISPEIDLEFPAEIGFEFPCFWAGVVLRFRAKKTLADFGSA
jgi:hypothetical protein